MLLVLAALAAALAAPGSAEPPRYGNWHPKSKIRVWKIHYRAHDGARSTAYVLLPRWYGKHRHPRILERPILVRGARAVVGRPPERVLSLL